MSLQNALTTQHHVCMHVCAFMFKEACTLGYHVLPSALFGAQQSAHGHQLGPGVHYICSCSCVASPSADSPANPAWDVCSSRSLFTRNTQEKGRVRSLVTQQGFQRTFPLSFGKCKQFSSSEWPFHQVEFIICCWKVNSAFHPRALYQFNSILSTLMRMQV